MKGKELATYRRYWAYFCLWGTEVCHHWQCRRTKDLREAQSLRRGDKPFRNIVSIDSHRVAAEILTNIYINPPVAPPLVGGYGFGYGVPFYGGWGWSPFSFFAPGPSVAIGVGGGFEVLVLFMFLGAVAAVIRRFAGSKDEDDDYY
ncbi:hypothetical protein CK203_098818 [Vitis vinifera]|uniref:Transmembrane protein n=1 Tax=Vitis vinifera TaxID=29760 RepID=A0A438D494_VITVI|nr:hypothetical protein CK203_098818 [Vitis vinifera]